ncbi:MAG: hypothetical protein ACOY3Y_06055 [Acidobacteriota bacterium]
MAGNELTVNVTYNGAAASLDKPLGECFWETGPANVRWVFHDTSSAHDALSFGISWTGEAPFDATAQDGTGTADWTATGNKEKAGDFGYSVTVTRKVGPSIELNAVIRNDRRP